MNYNNFECVFNNTYRSSTKKKTSRKTLSKRDDRLFNNNNNTFNNLYKFYSKYNYDHIIKIYQKMYNIIIDSNDKEEKKWNYTSGLLLYSVNYFLIYKIHEIILHGDFGIPFFINKIKKTIKFIKNDTNPALYIKEKADKLINYQNHIDIENNRVIKSAFFIKM